MDNMLRNLKDEGVICKSIAQQCSGDAPILMWQQGDGDPMFMLAFADQRNLSQRSASIIAIYQVAASGFSVSRAGAAEGVGGGGGKPI